MVPNTKLMEVLEKIKGVEETFNGLVDNFIRAYPDIVEMAKERSADLFKEGQCPSVDEVRNKFSFNYHLEPMPNSDNFDQALGLDDIRKEIKEGLDAQMERVFVNAEKELENRLLERARAFYKGFSDSKRKVSSSIFKNTVEIIKGVRSLNIRQSTHINELADSLSEIASKNGEYYLNPLYKEDALTSLRQILGISTFVPPQVNDELESALARL